jgi:4-amino-4-deoxy-L-arabinose transferase-like glycosyltransferase
MSSDAQSHPPRWPALKLVCAVALALVIGLAYVKWLQPLAIDKGMESYLRHYPGISGRGLEADEFQYLSIAKCISTGAGYSLSPGEPTAIRVPGYPLFNAALFLIFGSSLNVALLGNVFLIALLPALTFALAKLAFGYRTAAFAAFFCALDPGLYYFGVSEAMSETLFTVLLCSAILMWLKVQPQWRSERGNADQEGRSTGVAQPHLPPETRVAYFYALAAGLLFGAAGLTRTGFLPVPFFILAIQFVFQRNHFPFKKAVVLGLAVFLIASPWALRNRAVMGTMMFSTTNDGVTLLGTVLAAQQHRGDWLDPELVAPEYARIHTMSDPVERNRVEKSLAIAELRKISPITLAKVAVKRVFRLWVPLNRIVSDQVGFKANVAVNLFYFPAMLLAAFGLWKARGNPAIIPLWATCLYLTLLAAVSWGGTRMRYPAEPFLCIFAAHGLFEMYKLFSARGHRVSAS